MAAVRYTGQVSIRDKATPLPGDPFAHGHNRQGQQCIGVLFAKIDCPGTMIEPPGKPGSSFFKQTNQKGHLWAAES